MVVKDYIKGLEILSERYDDACLLTFVQDFEKSDAYKIAFEKTVALAQKRQVSEHKMLTTKTAIDNYFLGGK